MTTNYPSALDDSTTQPTAADLANDNLDTKPHSTVHGNHGEAIIAIETELGTDPSGASATVKARLDSLDTTVAAKYAPGGTDVAVADGGTGASTAAGARTNLGVAIGSDVQAYDGDLATLASAFGSASASGPATLAFHEDTDNGTNKITVSGVASVVADRTLTLPDADDTLVGKATTDTLTNKTVDLTSNTLVGSVAEFNAALESADFYTSGGTDVAVADGGTGASTAAGARTNLDVPSNAEAVLDTLVDAKGDLVTATAADTPARLAVGTDGLFLKANSAAATGLEWAAGGGGASALDDLTDVTITTPATGATLVYNGSAWIDGQLDLADADAVTGILPNANLDADLAALGGLTSAADKVPYFTGSGTAAVTDLTSAARTVLDDTTVAAMRDTLGVGQVIDTDTGQTQTGAGVNLTDASLINTNGIVIPDDTAVAGDVYRFVATGEYSLTAVTGGATLLFKLVFGGTTITLGATFAPNAQTNARPWTLDVEMLVISTTAQRLKVQLDMISATAVPTTDGVQAYSAGRIGSAATTEDMTSGNKAFDITVTTTGTTPTWSVTCHDAWLEKVPTT